MSNLDDELAQINKIDHNINNIIEAYEEKMDDETPEKSPPLWSTRNLTKTDRFTPSMDNKRYTDEKEDEYEDFPKAFMNLQCGEEQEYDDIHAVILARCLTQYGLKKAINKFGDDAVNALVKEVSQLHNRDVLRPVHWSDLSKDEQKEAIESIIRIKEKRDRSLKGRACADGMPQRYTTT